MNLATEIARLVSDSSSTGTFRGTTGIWMNTEIGWLFLTSVRYYVSENLCRAHFLDTDGRPVTINDVIWTAPSSSG